MLLPPVRFGDREVAVDVNLKADVEGKWKRCPMLVDSIRQERKQRDTQVYRSHLPSPSDVFIAFLRVSKQRTNLDFFRVTREDRRKSRTACSHMH